MIRAFVYRTFTAQAGFENLCLFEFMLNGHVRMLPPFYGTLTVVTPRKCFIYNHPSKSLRLVKSCMYGQFDENLTVLPKWEPLHDKTNNLCFRIDGTQISLYSRWLEAGKLEFRK